MGVTLEQVATELYATPLEDFVASRNARAKELKTADPALAARVAKLPKPVVTAHQLNTFARRHTGLLDEVLDLGAALREAQQQRDGERVRALTQQATGAIRRAVQAMPATDPVPFEQTLRAAMADDGAAAALRAGLLVKPLAPAGFGEVDLSGAVAVETSGPLPPRRTAAPAPRRTDQEAEKRAAQERVAREAAEARAKAESALADQEEVLSAAAADHRAAQERVARAQAALEQARQDEREAGKRERSARQERDAAQRKVERLSRG